MRTISITVIMVIILFSYTLKQSHEYGSDGGLLKPFIPYSDDPLGITTDQKNYTSINRITITIHVLNPNNDDSLVIKVLNKFDLPVASHAFEPSTNQSYTLQVLPVGPLFNTSGNYTTLAQYGPYQASTYFQFTNVNTGIVAKYAPPLKQLKSGIAAKDVKCHDDLLLTFKAEDGSPACVNPETAKKLYERGWASVLTIKLNVSSSNQPVEIIAIRSVGPVNPGGPIIQLTLKNIGMAPITSLNATLELNNDYTFDFKDITESKPLAPGQSASDTKILIGAGSTELVPLTISGVDNNISFRYTENVHVS